MSSDVIRDSPRAEADFTIDRERWCFKLLPLLLPSMDLGWCCSASGDCSRGKFMFSVEELPAEMVSSSMEMEKRGRMSRAQTPFRLRLICGEKSSLSVCELSGVLREKLPTVAVGGVAAVVAWV